MSFRCLFKLVFKTVLFWNQHQNRHCINKKKRRKKKKKIADQPIKSVLSPRYWRFNEEMRTMDPGYPKPITIWRGVPDSPQGAFVDKANGTSCPVLSRRRAASCASRPSSIQRLGRKLDGDSRAESHRLEAAPVSAARLGGAVGVGCVASEM